MPAPISKKYIDFGTQIVITKPTMELITVQEDESNLTNVAILPSSARIRKSKEGIAAMESSDGHRGPTVEEIHDAHGLAAMDQSEGGQTGLHEPNTSDLHGGS
jgi:hypothetical protein